MIRATLLVVCAACFIAPAGSDPGRQDTAVHSNTDMLADRAHAIDGPKSLRVIDADAENLGRRPVGQFLTRRVVLKNVIDVPVEVVLHERTCGCLRSECSTRQVEPGETVTITLSATVAPVVETQNQAVIYHARWTLSGTEHSERFMLKLTYTADITFSVNPDRVCVTVPRGERRSFDLLVHWASVERRDPPVFSRVTSTLGDVNIRAVRNTPNNALVYRVDILGGPPGTARDGVIELGDEFVVSIRVPLRIIDIDMVRAMPGGINFVIDPHTNEQRLERTAQISQPVAYVRCVPVVEGLHVNHHADRLDVTFITSEKTAPRGRTRLVFYSDEGVELGDMPALWWTRDRPSPSGP